MSIKTRAELKQLFTTGAKPTQQNFADWLDSYKHTSDLQQPSLPAAPSPVNGDLWYNTAAGQFQGTRGGAAQNFLMGNDAQIHTGHVIIVDADAPQATDVRTNAGTYNASIPFKTIQAAVAAGVQADMVLVLPGTYNENITLTQTQNLLRIVLSGATLNGDIVNYGLSDGFYAGLQNGATVNGVIGQYSNFNGFCEIEGDGTATIVTGNRSLFSNIMRVSGLKLLNSGTALCASAYQGNIQVRNCRKITGGLAAYMKDINNINASTYTAGYVGIVQLINIGSIGNMNCPANGSECYIKATNCYFLSTSGTTFSNVFGVRTYFKNCRFYHPTGLTGFTNNANGNYVFEDCSFYFVTPPAYAISATPNTGTVFILVNCVSNAGDIMNGSAPSVIKVNCSSIPSYMLPDY